MRVAESKPKRGRPKKKQVEEPVEVQEVVEEQSTE
jgi:hypothetical protein